MMTTSRALFLLLLLLATLSCGGDDAAGIAAGTAEDATADVSTGMDTGQSLDTSPPPPSGQNVLLIIADDLGLDHAECYGATGSLASTPTIGTLCEEGVVFANAWAMPTCSPTRAAMLTGRYPLRHGVGAPSGGSQPGLPEDEQTIPRVLNAHPDLGVTHANIGKWHLSAGMNIDGDPNAFGWGHFSGIIQGVVNDYYAWTKVVDGVSEVVETYVTTALVDDAIAWLDAQDGPWVLWLALNAPHAPFHIPPPGLHSQSLPDTPGDCPLSKNATCYRAAIEAMDSEISRLLASMDADTRANTNIIYLGDNGSPGQVAQDPVTSKRAKGTLYEGGVHVPFVVHGPAVVEGGRSVDAIIDVTDVFATVLTLAGVDVADLDGITIDSVSLVPYLTDPAQAPLREWTLSELYASAASNNQPGRTIRDVRFKLIVFLDGREEFYDLLADPWETTDLLAGEALDTDAEITYDTLSATLEGPLAAP